MDTPSASGVTAQIGWDFTHRGIGSNFPAVRITVASAGGYGIQVYGAAVTTGFAITVPNLDALTTGGALSIVSNSTDTTARSLVSIVNDATAAVGAVCLTLQNDATAGAHMSFTGTGILGIDFTALGATDKLFNATAASGCTAAPQTNAAIGFLGIKVAGTDQWIPYYNAT